MSTKGKQPARITETERPKGGPGMGPPGMMGGKALDFGGTIRRLIGMLRPERVRILFVMIFSLIAVAMSSLAPRVLGTATDLLFAGILGRQLPEGITREQAIAGARAQGQEQFADLLTGVDFIPGQGIDFSAVGSVVLFVLGLYLISSLLQFFQGWLLNDAVQGTVYRMRGLVEDKLNALPLSYFDRQPRGELLSRVTNDIDNVQQSLQQTMSQLLTSVLTVIFILIMMFSISPVLSIVALLTIPVTMVVAGLIMSRSRTQFMEQWRTTGTLNSRVEEAFTGHDLVKVFGRQREVQAQFETENEQLYQSSFKAQFLSGLIMPASMFIGNLNYAFIAVLGALRVASGTISLGEVQAFIQYSRQFTQPVTQIAAMVNLLQSGAASAERVFELLDADEQNPEQVTAALEPVIAGRVEFQNVSFRYQPDQPLIEDLSFVAEPGQTVAIVGPTGAGKTTLVNLIMRFYEIDSGRILIDGIDITELSRDDLRSRIGMVLQDTWLYHDTIRENLRYGRLDATDAEIMEAARATYVDRFAQSLPDGYDTLVDDEGGVVSVGEKQLLTIARAFLARPSILVLDEATSSVDTRTELLLQDAMMKLRSERTSFVIAHRLSTIRNADLIIVMQEGRIVEQGTHNELMELGGAYLDLQQAQFQEDA